ncbi:hypothetical protein XENTR_v10010690 [Xenopus tropicalis]|nr:hypothetical protein XENTR_v10010690 [Xenopus tropicalis]
MQSSLVRLVAAIFGPVTCFPWQIASHDQVGLWFTCSCFLLAAMEPNTTCGTARVAPWPWRLFLIKHLKKKKKNKHNLGQTPYLSWPRPVLP